VTGCGITAARAGLSLVCFQVCLQSEEKAYYRFAPKPRNVALRGKWQFLGCW